MVVGMIIIYSFKNKIFFYSIDTYTEFLSLQEFSTHDIRHNHDNMKVFLENNEIANSFNVQYI